MLNVLFALIGLLVGVVVNVLADDLPRRQRPSLPHCHTCQRPYPLWQWLGVGRCAQCGAQLRWRVPLVVGATAVLFAILPSLIAHPVDLLVNALYTAVFILIIVTDLEHRLILDVVTIPTTLLAIALSLVVTDNSWQSALLGTAVGLGFFALIYWGAQLIYGAGSAAFGLGDVKLAMAMGAMLGFHRVLFAYVLGILLGGAVSLLVLLLRRNRRLYLPYGQYLAIAAIIMLLWGGQIARWYAGMGQ